MVLERLPGMIQISFRYLHHPASVYLWVIVFFFFASDPGWYVGNYLEKSSGFFVCLDFFQPFHPVCDSGEGCGALSFPWVGTCVRQKPTVLDVPGSKLPLFPYNRGWETQPNSRGLYTHYKDSY